MSRGLVQRLVESFSPEPAYYIPEPVDGGFDVMIDECVTFGSLFVILALVIKATGGWRRRRVSRARTDAPPIPQIITQEMTREDIDLD